jgi:lysophospholipase L1-like esterase
MFTFRKRTFLLTLVFSALATAQSHWVVTWGASPAPLLPNERDMASAKLEFSNQTVREIVHASLGGTTVRVRLSNAYGRGSAEIGGAHIALRASGAAIVPASDRTLTFGGRPSTIIPADAEVLSDPVQLDVPAAADLAISIYLPKRINGAGIHYSAQQTSYIAPSDATGRASLADPVTFTSWAFLAEVDVQAPQNVYAIAAFGDSITDGAASGLDVNARWLDILAGRLLAEHRQVGVINAGIGGNRILHDPATNIRFGENALARFDRDVLSVPGVRYVIMLEGINDIGHAGSSAPEDEAVSADDLIGAFKQIIARAHDHGIRVIGATLTPFEGAARGYFTSAKEATRKALNQWIRSSGDLDGVIDFEQAVRDPANPDRMAAAFDSGDHLHPKAAGYKAMGESIKLTLFAER